MSGKRTPGRNTRPGESGVRLDFDVGCRSSSLRRDALAMGGNLASGAETQRDCKSTEIRHPKSEIHLRDLSVVLHTCRSAGRPERKRKAHAHQPIESREEPVSSPARQ